MLRIRTCGNFFDFFLLFFVLRVDFWLLQIFANYCKLKLTIAQLLHMMLHFLQILKTITNNCKLLHIDPHLCTQTSEFAHSQPGLLSNSTLCPAPDVESYNDEYHILICNTYIKYISKWIKWILLKQHQFESALLYFFHSESCGRLSHPNAYKDHTSLPGEPGPTRNRGFFFIENWTKADDSEIDEDDDAEEVNQVQLHFPKIPWSAFFSELC